MYTKNQPRIRFMSIAQQIRINLQANNHTTYRADKCSYTIATRIRDFDWKTKKEKRKCSTNQFSLSTCLVIYDKLLALPYIASVFASLCFNTFIVFTQRGDSYLNIVRVVQNLDGSLHGLTQLGSRSYRLHELCQGFYNPWE